MVLKNPIVFQVEKYLEFYAMLMFHVILKALNWGESVRCSAVTKVDPFQFEMDLVDLFWWLIWWHSQCVFFSEKGISLSLGGTRRLLVCSVRAITRCVMLNLPLGPTIQLRPSWLRPPYAVSLHPHTRTELPQVMRVILQAYLHWEETMRTVF